MISSSEFSSRVEKMIKSGNDKKEAPIKAVLDFGIEKGNITDSEASAAMDCLQSFLSSHPGFAFLSPKERWKRGTQQSEAERKMWSAIQPVLDKAQGIHPTTE